MKKYQVLKGTFNGHKKGDVFRDNYTRAHKQAIANGTIKEMDANQDVIVADTELKSQLDAVQTDLDKAQADLKAALDDKAKLQTDLDKAQADLKAALDKKK